MTEAQEKDAFLRMAITALSASAHGVHKQIPVDRIIRRGQELALKLWAALLLFKAEQSGEQWASMKIDAVAYISNMMAHNHDLADESLINDAINCAMTKWAMHQQWREKQS